MAFRGLFVGIDRYASPEINWLSCAEHDAVALHALFTDTLGSGAVLLTDEDATRPVIEEQFHQLASCDKDDVVVWPSRDMEVKHTNLLPMTPS